MITNTDTKTDTSTDTSTSTDDEHALSHDSPDDTLGVELDQVYARLAADEHAVDVPKEPDDDGPHGP